MANSILVITDCQEHNHACKARAHNTDNSDTVTLQLVNVASTNPAIPQLNHAASCLTDIATVEFSVEEGTTKVFLVIDREYSGFSLSIVPTNLVSVTSGPRSSTKFEFSVPGADQPNFNWEFVAKDPGIPLKVTVKRK